MTKKKGKTLQIHSIFRRDHPNHVKTQTKLVPLCRAAIERQPCIRVVNRIIGSKQEKFRTSEASLFNNNIDHRCHLTAITLFSPVYFRVPDDSKFQLKTRNDRSFRCFLVKRVVCSRSGVVLDRAAANVGTRGRGTVLETVFELPRGLRRTSRHYRSISLKSALRPAYFDKAVSVSKSISALPFAPLAPYGV